MTKKKIAIHALLFLLCLISLNQAFAQQQFTNTLFYDEAQGSPAADFDDLSWLPGVWRGEAMGGQTEEIWSAPLGNSMMGSFKLVMDNEVVFYELETITQTADGSLIMRLKHFKADLKGWEEKDETVDFKLVKVTPNKVYFNGLTFERVSDQELNIYVVIEEEGKTEEVKFNFHRVN